MKSSRIAAATLIFLMLLPISAVFAKDEDDWEFEDRINEGASAFFLVDLEEEDELEISVEAYEEGKFELFLFDERPEKTHVNADKSIDKEIYKEAVDYDKGSHPDVNLTADDDQIYYVQIVLTRNGPEYYTLESNYKLSRYYLPQLPGYHIEIMVCSIIFSIGIIYLYIRRKKLTIRV